MSALCRLLRRAALLLALAWLLARDRVRQRSLVCPPQCEVSVVPVGGERLRAVCWCEGGEGR